ncbi:hydrogenase nickel incorporation protein HypB [Desulfoluna limicola]|uniref:Hydrogenase nickel incorporation protein HypB n=1 Tax=Desulfoluna limicola TaxID=2810562 RepID=A0ABM7PHU1_9BACT|nr:hydrogenase nickel incorporation protein HypB [Desulfoluna limicola]BCS96769.1 hydrogenase nickel incorporation protein HypB [Desulfoluna limicola]
MDIPVVRNVLDANNAVAEKNRALFDAHGVFVLNMMSAPGSGKTEILVKSLGRLLPELRCSVIVGDISTTNDAERLLATGAAAVQINTDAFGSECHIGAHVIEKALESIPLAETDLLIIENIGNLVCPAEFDLGEDTRVVVISVTEGEDKPLKYPLMFRESEAAIYNKIDLLPHLDYDMEVALANINSINPAMPVFGLSARTEDGFHPWLEWVKTKVSIKQERSMMRESL